MELRQEYFLFRLERYQLGSLKFLEEKQWTIHVYESSFGFDPGNMEDDDWSVYPFLQDLWESRFVIGEFVVDRLEYWIYSKKTVIDEISMFGVDYRINEIVDINGLEDVD